MSSFVQHNYAEYHFFFKQAVYHPTHNQSYLLVEHDVIVKFAVIW